jgi:hypothetical protein
MSHQPGGLPPEPIPVDQLTEAITNGVLRVPGLNFRVASWLPGSLCQHRHLGSGYGQRNRGAPPLPAFSARRMSCENTGVFFFRL